VVALQIQPMAEITHTQVAVLQIHQMAEFIHIKVAVSHIYSLPEVVQTGGRFVHSPNGRGHTNNWQFRTFVRWSGQTPRWPFRIYTRWPRSNKKMAAQHIHQGNKQNMLFVNSDVYAQLRPRNVDRKERHPGARERNSNKRQRLQDKRKIPPENAPMSRATEPQFHPTYSHDSAVKDFGRHETCSEQNEQQKVTSYYQELSTIEAIRKTMQPKSKKYINQMLTFHHMKHHEKKIRLAKHRKRLVDQRISDSWSMSSNSPTPMTQRRFHNEKNVTSSDSQNVTTRRNISNEDTSETKQTKYVVKNR
ncbi:hypothetical protein MAR_012609, partial [Mya arenaria]